MSLPLVLYLEPLSRSLSYRYYLDRLAGHPALQWLQKRLQADHRQLVVIHHHREEEKALRAAVSNEVLIHTTRSFNKTKALALLQEELGVDHIGLITLGTGLAPESLAKQVWEHHRNGAHDYTTTRGLPKGCGISIFSQKMLSQLQEIAVSALIIDPDEAVARAQALQRSLGLDLPFNGSTSVFDAAKAFKIGVGTLPTAIHLDRESELRRAERVIARTGDNPSNPMALLYEWHHECTQSFAQERRSNGNPTWSTSHSKERVLFISSPSGFSGAEESLCSMISCLDTSRYEFFALVGLEGTFARRLRELGVAVTTALHINEQTIPAYRFLSSYMRAVEPDIAHLNTYETPLLLSVLDSLHIPFVQHIRNGAIEEFREQILSASSLVAVSQYLQNKALSLHAIPENLAVIYDEVDTDVFRPNVMERSSARATLGLSSDAKVLLLIARFASNKRHDVAVRALAILARQYPDVVLVLKSDLYRDSLVHEQTMALIDALGVGDHIRWLDFVEDIRVPLAAADILVLCSEDEGLGRCVVEALAMEVPVVVSDSGGTQELIESGSRGGFVTPLGDAEQLAERVGALLQSPMWAKFLARAGRESILAKVDATYTAQAVMAVYERLTKRTKDSMTNTKDQKSSVAAI